jgi:hypothetical protein
VTVDLAALYGYFGLDEREGPRYLMFAARATHYTLPYLVLSAVEQAGLPMGAASTDELARARERASTYNRLSAALIDVADARVLKGSVLSARYPPGLLRASGDLDVVVPDEARLWRAVRWLVDCQPDAEITVSLFGTGGRHIIVALSWDAADNLSDPSYRVEVSTAALAGDFGAVPVRAPLPADPLVGVFLALAEERLQRPFHPRDFIDVAVLAEGAFPPSDQLLTTVDQYRLAPEAAELLARAAEHAPLGALAELAAQLEPAVARERSRRAEYVSPTSPDPDDPVATRMATGEPLYGMQLRRRHVARQVAELHSGSWGTILRAPVGDYLLVPGLTVHPNVYERALAEADRLAEDSPSMRRPPTSSTC